MTIIVEPPDILAVVWDDPPASAAFDGSSNPTHAHVCKGWRRVYQMPTGVVTISERYDG